MRQAIEFWQGEEGQDMVEYSLLMAFIALAILSLLTAVGNDISAMWTSLSSTMGSVAGRGVS